MFNIMIVCSLKLLREYTCTYLHMYMFKRFKHYFLVDNISMVFTYLLAGKYEIV